MSLKPLFLHIQGSKMVLRAGTVLHLVALLRLKEQARVTPLRF